MLQKIKYPWVGSLVFLPLSLLLVFFSSPTTENSSAFSLAYHTLALFCLPLFLILFSEHPFFLSLGLLFGEVPLFFWGAFSLGAFFYLFLLFFCLYGLFRLLVAWSHLLWAQIILPFLFYTSMFALFLSNEFLYQLSSEIRPFFLAFLIDSNPFLLLMGSILKQDEFFRSYWMYNTLSDVGSYYPHHFPSATSIYLTLSIFALWPIKTAFDPIWKTFRTKK